MENLEGFLEELSALTEKYGLYIKPWLWDGEGPFVSRTSDDRDIAWALEFEPGNSKKPGRYVVLRF